MTFPPAQPTPGYAPEPNPVSPLRAISYGWNKFSQNAGTWVLAVLVALLLTCTIIGALVVGPMLTRGALLELDGRKPRLGEFFGDIRWGAAILVQFVTFLIVLVPLLIAAALIVGAVSMADNAATIFFAVVVGLLAVVVTVALAFLTYFAMAFVIDRRAGAVESLKWSISAIRSQVGPLLLLALLNEVMISVASSACYIPLLIAYPVFYLSAVYSFRVVTGGAISPDRPQMVMPPPGFGPPPGYGWNPPPGPSGPGGFPPQVQ